MHDNMAENTALLGKLVKVRQTELAKKLGKICEILHFNEKLKFIAQGWSRQVLANLS